MSGLKLEDRLVKLMNENKEINLLNSTLVASNINDINSIKEYRSKFELLFDNYKQFINKNWKPLENMNDGEKMVSLREFLWKDNSYSRDQYFVDKGIDNRLNNENLIGNCLYLTSETSILADMIGLKLGVKVTPNHIYNFANINGREYDIENTNKNSIRLVTEKTQEFEADKKTIKLPNTAIISGLFNNRAVNEYNEGRILEAMKLSENAINCLQDYEIPFIGQRIENIKGIFDDPKITKTFIKNSYKHNKKNPDFFFEMSYDFKEKGKEKISRCIFDFGKTIEDKLMTEKLVKPLSQQAHEMFKGKQFNKSLEMYDDIFKQFSNNSYENKHQDQYRAAVCMTKNERDSEAIDIFENLLNRYDNVKNKSKGNIRDMSFIHYQKGNAHLNLGKAKEAITEFNNALDKGLNENYVHVKINSAKKYLSKNINEGCSFNYDTMNKLLLRQIRTA